MNLKKKMLSMDNWAVIGARPDKSTMGYKIPEILEKNGYTVYRVNPNHYSIEGKAVYAAIGDIGKEIDCVDILVNPKIAIAILEGIRDSGIKYVCFQPGTYNRAVLEKAEELKIEYITDCIYAALKNKGM